LNLRIPGPTPCPDDVMEAMSHPMINHRSSEFKDVMLRVTQGIKDVMKTEADLLILSASGTGGLEAAIVNVLLVLIQLLVYSYCKQLRLILFVIQLL